MRKIESLIFILLIIFWNSLFPQELDIKKLLNDIEKGETEKARILLVSLEKDNPSSASVKFLKAILSEDGKEAAKLYREVVFSTEETDLKDDALFKLYQYHYSRSDFSESDKYARMLKETFPQSEYLTYLKREVRSESRITNQPKFEQKILSDTTLASNQTQKSIPQKLTKYQIQVGAFSNEANAKKFASQFTGYITRITEKEIAGKKLFVVLVGDYESENSARNEIQNLKNKFKVDGILVTSQ
ncbi:MAG: SPOR domain-containing protein [Ignavibacteria bacterium]|nr:SPOR domain-containing protein [Ignavibacteria bacterium]